MQSKTIADLIRAYYSYIKKYYNSKEPANIKYAIEFLRSKYHTMPIEDFGPLKLKALRTSMIKEKNWVRSVINRRINMIVAAIRKAYDTKRVDATGQNKAIEMIHERQYNKAGIKGCSGGLDSFVNDCGYRKSSHRAWYKETGQIKEI